MGAFSVASVAGVPLGSVAGAARRLPHPFFVVAGLGLLIPAFTFVVLPPLRSHLQQLVPARSLTEILRRPVVRLALTTIAVSNMATFAIVPSMAPYLIRNCGMRRTDLEYMYALGGACTFVSMRIVGWLVDRYGAARVMVLASLFCRGARHRFLPEHNLLPITIVFVGFLISVSSRNVCVNATCSRVAAPSERARYQSLQSAVQHMASAVEPLGPIFLHELADGRLGGNCAALGAVHRAYAGAADADVSNLSTRRATLTAVSADTRHAAPDRFVRARPDDGPALSDCSTSRQTTL